ncbi:regulator of ribonuclease activity A [Bradyrhizobium sp. LM6.10]|uniref:ribonuclease E activity regulator RraA n=1 Tax=unclassified Bradyrhizobium TaxID=2631580 RepID=UPI001FF99926|nr:MULTISPECIES: ribonuclease E activity regulator RraA [unclassified Bradyrhizobium]MCK1572817.1 ribonuclease E activity regulator RraA [Bradyrhizobium sp. 174]MCK1695293.1 ribonuclease E activity regulator RraA [Bradyrhizobium sp. 144]
MNLKTSDLCDARADIQSCQLQFMSFGRRPAFAGFIHTVRYDEGMNIIKRVANQPAHDQVLVIDGAGSRSFALFGDRMAEIVLRNGWAGVVVNGVIRDCEEIDAMDIGVKALGTVPNRPSLAGEGTSDITVTFGEVSFIPGRRLVADRDGLVVLPEGLTEADIPVADAIAATAAYLAGSS